MKNFKVIDKETNKEYWISRAMAVSGFITVRKNNETYFLLERRGIGCCDEVGKIAAVCGYLDFDETRREALIRECNEELGLDISNSLITEICIVDDPKENKRQNITTRYLIELDNYDEIIKFVANFDPTLSEKRGGEADEVSELMLLSSEQIYNMKDEDFAFNHRQAILEILRPHFSCF